LNTKILPKTFSTSPIQISDTRAFGGEISYTRPTVSNSCRGLLGLYNQRDRQPVVLFNPLTGQYLTTPNVHSCDLRHSFVGLGYTEPTKQFKFLRISFGKIVQPALVEVYTVGTLP